MGAEVLEIEGGQIVRLAQGDGRTERVLELADVAGPVVDEEPVEKCLGHALDRLLRRMGMAVEEALDQRDDVLFPVPERRHVDRGHAQAVVQVLPELSLAYHAARSRFVAEITRTFTWTSFVLPTG